MQDYVAAYNTWRHVAGIIQNYLAENGIETMAWLTNMLYGRLFQHPNRSNELHELTNDLIDIWNISDPARVILKTEGEIPVVEDFN